MNAMVYCDFLTEIADSNTAIACQLKIEKYPVCMQASKIEKYPVCMQASPFELLKAYNIIALLKSHR
jgi:hypothetical protein